MSAVIGQLGTNKLKQSHITYALFHIHQQSSRDLS